MASLLYKLADFNSVRKVIDSKPVKKVTSYAPIRKALDIALWDVGKSYRNHKKAAISIGLVSWLGFTTWVGAYTGYNKLQEHYFTERIRVEKDLATRLTFRNEKPGSFEEYMRMMPILAQKFEDEIRPKKTMNVVKYVGTGAGLGLLIGGLPILLYMDRRMRKKDKVESEEDE